MTDCSTADVNLLPANRHDCTVIIATLALKERRDSLDRAIKSARTGNKSSIRVLLILNGDRFHLPLVEELRARQDVELIQIPEASLSAAILEGRKQVQSPFFAFLDDDDEYLPGAVDLRITLMEKHPEASVVATNGYRCLDGNDQPAMPAKGDGFIDEPQQAMLEENWLASCGGLYRSKDLPISLFEGVARYLEWTWIGFRIASSGRKVFFSSAPTFRIHDTIASESKSDAYFANGAQILERMKSIASDKKTKKLLRQRLAQAWHDTSEFHRRRGNTRPAWHAHLRSLIYPTGFRYLAYTRRLLF